MLGGMLSISRALLLLAVLQLLLQQLLLVVTVSVGGVAAAASELEVVDLSHEYRTNSTLSWPTLTHFTLQVISDGVPPGKDYYVASNDFATSEHSGTHLDAPIHFYKDRWTVEQIPLEHLINVPVFVIDISAKVRANSTYNLDVSDIVEWERRHGQLPSQPFALLIDCGWAHRWPDKLAYFGTASSTGVGLIFPGISESAARWLVSNRASMVAVGLDSPSIDDSGSTTFMVHRIFFERNIYALENLANLSRLPPTGARLWTLPMKIAGGSGAPARVIAVIKEDNGSNVATSINSSSLLAALIIATVTLYYKQQINVIFN